MLTEWLLMLQAPYSHLRQEEGRRDGDSNICPFLSEESRGGFYLCLIGQDRVTWPPLLQEKLGEWGIGDPGWLRPVTVLLLGLRLLL